MVAFASSRGGAGFQIWTLVPNGTLPATQLVQVTDAGHNDFHPSFSPDGQTIVFSSDRSGGNQLFRTTWNGSAWSAPVALTSGAGLKQNPDWSPNGLHIAYEVTSGSSAEIWVIDANGSNARAITTSGTYDARPDWSDDGNHLAFVSDRSGAKYIWLADGLTTPASNDSWGRIKALYRR
jgi:TolB protein